METNSTSELAHVGKVISAHGLRGEVYCLLFSGDNSWTSKLKSLTLKVKLEAHEYQIEKLKNFKKGFIVKLKEIQDRNLAEDLKGAELWVLKSLFTSKHGEALYLSEVLGFELIDSLKGSLGRVSHFSSNGMQDLLVIESDQKKFEVPFVKELVVGIDFKLKKIEMNLPEGLLEINDED